MWAHVISLNFVVFNFLSWWLPLADIIDVVKDYIKKTLGFILALKFYVHSAL